MAGVTRFRPILLTSATTFIGLAPLIATSNWATSFVIPMAISLAFGVMFATVITLFLVPALYMILEDFLGIPDEISRWLYERLGVGAPASTDIDKLDAL